MMEVSRTICITTGIICVMIKEINTRIITMVNAARRESGIDFPFILILFNSSITGWPRRDTTKAVSI